MSSIVVVYLFIFFITCVTKFCICFELVSRIKKPKKRSRKIRRVCLFVSLLSLFFYRKFSLICRVCVWVCVGELGVVGMPWVMRGHPCQPVDMWHKSRSEIERRCQCERGKLQMKMLLKYWKIYFTYKLSILFSVSM